MFFWNSLMSNKLNLNFGLQLENNDNLCYKLRWAVFRTNYNTNKDGDNNDKLKNTKVMTKMTIGRKQEGAEEQKSGIDDVSCHYGVSADPATRVIIFIIIIWSLWWWWWLSLWSRYTPTLNKVGSLFSSFDDRQYWWEPLMGTFRDPLRSLSPTFYYVLDDQNDHQHSIHHKTFPTNCKGGDACMRIGANWMGVCEN